MHGRAKDVAEVLESCAMALKATAEYLRNQDEVTTRTPMPVPAEPKKDPERWLTTKEFLERYRISRPTLIRWRNEGKVTFLRPSDGIVLYRPLE